MVLYINACVREESRTARLASVLLERLGEYKELRIAEMGLCPLDSEKLAYRTEMIAKCDYSDPMFDLSKEWREADTIVIAAPYWDLSFPAVLKTYLENIYVTGIVSEYDETGRPRGLCKAAHLYYVTTAGGPYNPDYSYKLLEDMALNMFGIGKAKLIFAENLDIWGNDPEEIIKKKSIEISSMPL